MLDDHARLRDKFCQLEALYDQQGPWRDLLEEVGQELEAHARLEDRLVFGYLESVLSAQDLDDILHRSQDFRKRMGRPMGKQ